MEGRKTETGPELAVLESVRCLECASVYSKPANGGTARANPGCPDCGYVGWISASIPFSRAFERTHSGAGHQPHPTAQSG